MTFILEYYKYTDKEKDTLLRSIVLLVDTREKKNQHIIDWLTAKNILFRSKALSNGDYSFYVPANPALNIDRDYYFDKHIMVERKRSLDELSANFTTGRARFEEELATYPGRNYLLIEGTSYQDIVEHAYRTELSAKAYLASLHTFNHRYHLEVMFMPDTQYSATWIYATFYYYLKSFLR